MKSFMMFAAVAAIVLLSGCESRTNYGTCVGIGDHQQKNLEYRISPRNIVVGVVFFELVAPPVIVLFDETYCPIGNKDIETDK